MNWFTWEQHKKQFLLLAIILVLYAGLSIPIGLHLWHVYQQSLAACKTANNCSQLSDELFQSGWTNTLNPASNGFGPVGIGILAMPFLLGLFIGVPLIANEYINGTNKLVWTRSVSRRTWLTVKLAWVLLATALFAALFATLTTLWSRAGNTLLMERFTGIHFAMQGIVPVGYAVFAVALGIMFGAWFKRVLPAMALTLVVFLALQIVVPNVLRPHYIAPKSYSTPVFIASQSIPAGSDALNGSWTINSQTVDAKEQAINYSNPPKQCIIPPNDIASDGNLIVHEDGTLAISGPCLNKLGYKNITNYQPAYRYRDFQRIEMGLYLVLSIIPIGATYRLVLKRDA
ncbi:MAG TPA: ABC transporter permease [Verrucomicrobiae bacterium]|nr:ABC transporter permease [Verrucomicrobiae bacterium]